MQRASANPGINWLQFSYVDPANPVFVPMFAGGLKTNGREILTPTGKRILVDGGSGNTGNYYHALDIPTAKGLYAAGDWILLPGGQTSTPNATVNFNSMAGGVSTSAPYLIGTYDPAHNSNSVGDEAFYNTLIHTMDFTSVGAGNDPITGFGIGGNLCWNSIKFFCPLQAGARQLRQLGSTWGQGRQMDNYLFENCQFDGVEAVVDAQIDLANACTIISSGTTATVTLTGIAKPALITGDVVGIQNAVPSAYNGLYSITVIDSTHFTYVFAGGTSPATIGGSRGTIICDVPFTRMPSTAYVNNVTFRYCSFMYGSNGTTSATHGNIYISGALNVRYEACVNFHGGWGRGITRATTASSGGPSILSHGIYHDDFVKNVHIMDCLHGWDSCNPKFTGNQYWLQNHISVRQPMSWIYDANTSNHGFAVFPQADLLPFQSQYHLAYNSDDCNTTDNQLRGEGPEIYEAVAGSYCKNTLLMNCDNPGGAGNRHGIKFGDNGFVGTYTPLMDNCILINWNFQDVTTTPDAHTTITFTNNWWDSPTSGSNTTISSLSGAIQTKLTNAAACNVHTTLRTAYPQFFSGVAVGGSNLATEQNMMEYMCQNPIPVPGQRVGWANILAYHARSKLA